MHWLREITEAKLGQVLSSGAMAKLSKAMGNKMGKLSGKKKFSGLKKDLPYYPIFAKETFRQKKDPPIILLFAKEKFCQKNIN